MQAVWQEVYMETQIPATRLAMYMRGKDRGRMIFKQWQQVLDRAKTQTRRPVKGTEKSMDGYTVAYQWVHEMLGSAPNSITDHRIWTTWEIKWKVGSTYAVQPGRGKNAVGRIRITKIRRERLQEISYRDCRDEGIHVPLRAFMWGVDDKKKFAKLWDSLYKKPYRWEDNPEVWVLEFELVDE